MKTQIHNLKDYAELAWAAYFNFDLENCVLETTESLVTLNEILSLAYNGKMAGIKEKVGQGYSFISKNKLNGEFNEFQARNFAKRYEIKLHQSNTSSGFSATLFGEKRKQIDSKTKEKSYTNEHGYINYILAIRGTESKESR